MGEIKRHAIDDNIVSGLWTIRQIFSFIFAECRPCSWR